MVHEHVCGFDSEAFERLCFEALQLCYPAEYPFAIRLERKPRSKLVSRALVAMTRKVPIEYDPGQENLPCLLEICERLLAYAHHVSGITSSDDYRTTLGRDSLFIALVAIKSQGPELLAEYLIASAKTERRIPKNLDNFLIRRPRFIYQLAKHASEFQSLSDLKIALLSLSVDPPPISGSVDLFPLVQLIENEQALPTGVRTNLFRSARPLGP